MTVHQYAEWALAATPDYAEAELARDMKAVLVKMYMRESVPGSSARTTGTRPATSLGENFLVDSASGKIHRLTPRPDTQREELPDM